MSFTVQVSIPTACRCRKILRLGHTATRCSNKEHSCTKCGKIHPSEIECVTHCINCGCKSHESTSFTCPAYLKMKKIIKMAFPEGITIKKARDRQSSLYSSAAKRASSGSAPQIQTQIQSQEMVALKTQVILMQKVVKDLKEASIPKAHKTNQNYNG